MVGYNWWCRVETVVGRRGCARERQVAHHRCGQKECVRCCDGIPIRPLRHEHPFRPPYFRGCRWWCGRSILHCRPFREQWLLWLPCRSQTPWPERHDWCTAEWHFAAANNGQHGMGWRDAHVTGGARHWRYLEGIWNQVHGIGYRVDLWTMVPLQYLEQIEGDRWHDGLAG